MARIGIISLFGLLAVAAANAGSIQVGGATGLTSTYISSGCAGVGPCVAGSVGGFQENNYDVRLFMAAGGTYTPYPTYNQTAGEQGTLGQFAMVDDGAGSNGSN